MSVKRVLVQNKNSSIKRVVESNKKSEIKACYGIQFKKNKNVKRVCSRYKNVKHERVGGD